MVSVKGYKEPTKINFPDDNNNAKEPLSVYELLLKNEGNYQKVKDILDDKLCETNKLIEELSSSINDLPKSEFEAKLQKLKRDSYETRLLCEEFRKIADRRNEEAMGDSKHRLSQKPPIIPRSTKVNVAIQSRPQLTDNRQSESNGYERVSELWQQLNETNNVGFESVSESINSDSEDALKLRQKRYKSQSAMDRLYRPHSVSGSISDHNDPESIVENWRHRVTVPVPFQMTLREEEQRQKYHKRTRSQAEFEQEKAEKEREEMEELKKQFRANPVPAHVYIPMYASMQEEANYRRQIVKEYSKEILKSIEKPFSFYKREINKGAIKCDDEFDTGVLEKSQVRPGSKKATLKSYAGERQKTIVRAKPIPKSCTENIDMEKLKEDELYRKIKAEIRAKQLMEEAKMPGSMEERQKFFQEKKLQKQLKKEHEQRKMMKKNGKVYDNVHSALRRSVPDFSKIHREWEEEIRMSSKEPCFTEPKPFRLMSEERAKKRESTRPVEYQNKEENDTIYKAGGDFEWSKSILSALEIAKPPTTKATVLREQSSKTKKEHENMKEYQKELEKYSRKKKEHEVGSRLRKSLDMSNLPQDKQKQKMKELKIENEQRRENYRQEIERLKERVYQKPLLFERKYDNKGHEIVGTGTGTYTNQYNTNNNNIHDTSNETMGNSQEAYFNGTSQSIARSNHSYSHPRTNPKFEQYDPKNNFGEPVSYKSTTEASSINSNTNYNGAANHIATNSHHSNNQHDDNVDEYIDDFENEASIKENVIIEDFD